MTLNKSRCPCGLRIALHFDDKRRKLTCGATRKRHPYAEVKKRSFRSLLAMSRRGR